MKLIPTAQLCTYTRYDQSRTLLGYAPWLQTCRDPEDAARDCFKQYGSDLKDGEWDCVDVHIFGLAPLMLSMLTPVTVTTNRMLRFVRRNGKCGAWDDS